MNFSELSPRCGRCAVTVNPVDPEFGAGRTFLSKGAWQSAGDSEV
jgi:hypothetical protein